MRVEYPNLSSFPFLLLCTCVVHQPDVGNSKGIHHHCVVVFIDFELDPGSERMLAAGLTHASRANDQQQVVSPIAGFNVLSK